MRDDDETVFYLLFLVYPGRWGKLGSLNAGTVSFV